MDLGESVGTEFRGNRQCTSLSVEANIALTKVVQKKVDQNLIHSLRIIGSEKQRDVCIMMRLDKRKK